MALLLTGRASVVLFTLVPRAAAAGGLHAPPGAPAYSGGMATDEDCLFCKIVSGDIPADVVHGTGTPIAFPDLDPQAPPHLPGGRGARDRPHHPLPRPGPAAPHPRAGRPAPPPPRGGSPRGRRAAGAGRPRLGRRSGGRAGGSSRRLPAGAQHRARSPPDGL